jgi:hypothetical protein
MPDSWLDRIDVLIERWRAEAQPVARVENDFGRRGGVQAALPQKAEAVAQAGLPPAESSGRVASALLELAEAMRTSMSELVRAVDGSAAAAAAAGAGRDPAELAAQVASLRAEVKAALFRPGALADGADSESDAPAPGATAAGAADQMVAALQPLAERLEQATRAGRAEQLEAIRGALAEFSQEDMVGRAGLAKSLKIGMADLAEKHRRALAQLQENLSGGGRGCSDAVSFYPESLPDRSVEVAGEVGAFPRGAGGEAARRIELTDCYAAQVNDDSMLPLAGEGQTLLISRSLPARNGDMVVARLADGRWVFKRYVVHEGRHQLQSLNPELGLPATVLDRPPHQVDVVVGVIYGRALARAPQTAGAPSTAGAGSAGR